MCECVCVGGLVRASVHVWVCVREREREREWCVRVKSVCVDESQVT